jgi:hypothetical protein
MLYGPVGGYPFLLGGREKPHVHEHGVLDSGRRFGEHCVAAAILGSRRGVETYSLVHQLSGCVFSICGSRGHQTNYSVIDRR